MPPGCICIPTMTNPNLLLLELSKHLQHPNVQFVLGDGLQVFTQEEDDKLCLTTTQTDALLKSACVVFTICSRLRIDPGLLALDMYTYKNKAKDVFTLTILHPKTIIHQVNCRCNTVGPPVSYGSCYEASGLYNLHVLAQKLCLQSLENRKSTEGSMMYTGSSGSHHANLTPQVVMRCINNGLSLADICVEFGWSTHTVDSPNFQSWCNCPCQLTTYDPNTMDKMVVDFYLDMEDVFDKDTDTDTDTSSGKDAEVGGYRCDTSDNFQSNRRESLKNMLYRVITRCRHCYIELPSKVIALIYIYRCYIGESVGVKVLQPDRVPDMLSFFNWSFQHHIAPNIKP